MAKNFEDISCIFCGSNNNHKDVNCSSCKNPLHIEKELVGKTINNYILKEYKARGYYGLTFKAVDNYGKDFAIKLISKNSYLNQKKDFQREAEIYASLPRSMVIVNYIGADETTILCKSISVEFYYIVCEWVNGETFRDFVSNQKLTPEDIISAARDLLFGLQELQDKNIWHNDLHDENVMVDKLSRAEMIRLRRSTPWKYIIIDVGSMVYRNPSGVKLLRDMVNVGNLLFQISEKLKSNFDEFSKEDQYFINLFDDACAQLIDENPSRAFSTPYDALALIEEFYRNSRLGELPTIKKLNTPYGYINANDIPSSWLLKHMFSDKLIYLTKIMSMSEQCVLISGPRGCGKTMFLKNMRFTTRYDSQEGDRTQLLIELPYIGLYVSARTSFGNFLVSVRQQEWIKDEAKVHLYFNILVSIELIDVLYRLSNDGLAKEQHIKPIIDLLSERFSIPYISLFTAKTRLVQISRLLIENKKVEITINNSTPAYLNDLTTTFRSAIPSVRDKEIMILIDDLSLPRIPLEIQKSIIPALFNTGANYKTRITAHSDGLYFQDYAGEVYKANRDYTEINLGYEFWQLSDNYETCRNIFDDILNKRFELSGRVNFVGLEEMLERGDALEDIGSEIHRLSQVKQLRFLKYYGAKVFIKLCSGDLSYLLDILGMMELRANKKTPIPIKIQSNVIKNYARNELRSLQDIKSLHDYPLYDIAYYFGIWSKSQLVKNNKDYIRIEFPMLGLPENLKTAARELLCYGIFIDGGFSNMSDGKTARKLLFRRIFTPAFPTTFNDRNTFPMRESSFKRFIENPKAFVHERMSEYDISPIDQQVLAQLELGLEIDE